MLTRLCLYDELMHVLLSRGQVYRALRIATQYRHVIRQESRTPHVFLQAAYDTNDPRCAIFLLLCPSSLPFFV